MKLLLALSLWLALIRSSGCGAVGRHETTTSVYYDESAVTPTPDYDYDYNATIDYYYVTASLKYETNASDQIVAATLTVEKSESSGSITNHRRIIKTLLMSLPALLYGTVSV